MFSALIDKVIAVFAIVAVVALSNISYLKATLASLDYNIKLAVSSGIRRTRIFGFLECGLETDHASFILTREQFFVELCHIAYLLK